MPPLGGAGVARESGETNLGGPPVEDPGSVGNAPPTPDRPFKRTGATDDFLSDTFAAPPSRRGRPRVVTAEKLSEILRLRSEGLGWDEIGSKLGLRPETCRWAARSSKRSGRAVENSLKIALRRGPDRP